MYEKGDRNVKENDKHLFLETILSAQSFFYISYIGRSAKDNATLPPSVLVDELIDYIKSGITTDENSIARLVTYHPLHSFSDQYKKSKTNLYDYLHPFTPALKVEPTKTPLTEPQLTDEISIDTFISFFKNPFKAYYNKVLKIHYDQETTLLPETEIFDLDGLQSWQLKQDLLFSSADIDQLRKRGVAGGQLPLANMANLSIAETQEELKPLQTVLNPVIEQHQEETYSLNVTIDNTILKGRLDHIYAGQLVLVSFSKKEQKYLLEAWIKFLIAIAAGQPLDLQFISATKNKLITVEEKLVSKKSALRSLEMLMKLYKRGHEEILLFYPDFDKNLADVQKLTPESFYRLVATHAGGEYCEPYLKKEYSLGLFENADTFEEFQQVGSSILTDAQPLFQQYY